MLATTFVEYYQRTTYKPLRTIEHQPVTRMENTIMSGIFTTNSSYLQKTTITQLATTLVKYQHPTTTSEYQSPSIEFIPTISGFKQTITDSSPQPMHTNLRQQSQDMSHQP